MNNLKIIFSFIVIACIVTSCEKDDVLNTNSNESFVKNKSINNKDGEVDLSTDEELLDFTNSLLEGTVPIEQEFINAVFNTEYALNVALSTPGKIPEYREQYIIIPSTLIIGSTVSGTDILDYYDDLYSQIYNLVDTAVLLGSGSKYITAIDLSYYPDTYQSGGAIPVIINVGRGNKNTCTFSGDYYVSQNMGGCGSLNPGTISNIDAADVISWKVGNKACNPNIVSCGSGGGPYIPAWSWYLVSTYPDPSQYSQVAYDTLNNFYHTTNTLDCVSELQQSNIETHMENWQNTNYPQNGKWGYVRELSDSWVNDQLWTRVPNGTPIHHVGLKLINTTGVCKSNIAQPCICPAW